MPPQPPQPGSRPLFRRAARVAAVLAACAAVLAVALAVGSPAQLGSLSTAPRAARASVACRPGPAHLRPRRDVAVTALAHRGHAPHANLVVSTPRSWVGLTFDDGPWPTTTPAVLAILHRFGAHATFFDVGMFAAHAPGLVRSELRAGNDVANHTFDHHQLTTASGGVRLSRATIRLEIRGGRDAICGAGAPAPRFFRPPYGRGLFTREVLAEARRAGERTVGWDVALDRYLGRSRTLDQAVAGVLTRVRPGSILLLHDGRVGEARHAGTLQALPRLLAGLRARGLRAVSLSRLLG
jgi:peptidoglycan-N-acetylglucosamine deacetylase